MKSLTKILTIILVLAAMVFLIYGYFFSNYEVIVPDGVSIITEPQLLEQMCYDGIARDEEGNLIKKQKEKACPT